MQDSTQPNSHRPSVIISRHRHIKTRHEMKNHIIELSNLAPHAILHSSPHLFCLCNIIRIHIVTSQPPSHIPCIKIKKKYQPPSGGKYAQESKGYRQSVRIKVPLLPPFIHYSYNHPYQRVGSTSRADVDSTATGLRCLQKENGETGSSHETWCSGCESSSSLGGRGGGSSSR